MIRILNIIAITLMPLVLQSQASMQGVPFVKNYSPSDYKAKNDNWAIAQDQRGIMYFGNKAGILEFDGVNWKNVAPDVSLLTMETDRNGTIFGAGINEAGYLSHTQNGQTIFISLIGNQTNDGAYFGNFYDIVFDSDTVLFFSNRGDLLKWHNGKLVHSVIAERITYSTKVGSKKYVISEKGLCELKDCVLKPIIGGKAFFDLRVRLILPIKNDSLLIISRTKGIFTFANGKLLQFNNPSNVFLSKNQVYRATQFNDSLIAIGTVENGVLIIDMKGNPLQRINRAGGLQSNDHCAIFADSRKNVWSGLEYGISCTYINSPFAQINEQFNLINATVYNMLLLGNYFYVGTAQGIYYSNWIINGEISHQNFKQITGTDARKVWVLNSFDGDLISSSSNVGTFLIKDFLASKISNHTAKELVQLNPNTIVGPIEHEGFGVFEKLNGRWEFKTQFQTFPNLFNPIVDSCQNIWANDNNQSIIRLKLNESHDSIIDISIFDTIPGLSSFKKANIFLLNSSIMLGSASGTFKLVNNQFIPYTEFNNEVGNNFHIQTKKIDLHGQEWVMGLKDGVEVVGRIVEKYGNSSELEVVNKKKETEKFEVELNLLPIARISDYLLFSFYPIDNQNILFGSSEKIIQYNPTQNQLCNDNFTVLIRYVETIKPFDSLLFGGAFLHNGKPINSQPETNYPSIQFVNNALRIKYAAIFFEGNEKNLYQIMLEGFDHEWSDWSAKAEKEYSYLKEGSYRFCVRAKNVYGIISPVTYYSFIILPPWYRTIWALLFYIAITAVTIILIVRISIYRLRKEKIKLEKIVAQRTAEILEQKEEIMVQNQVLLQNSEEILAQNELLNEQKDEILAQSETLKEKNKKITDQNFEITESIKYASTIQMALLTSNELVSILIPENFIIYKPLHIVSGDFYWIKKVNDVIVIAIADCTGHGVPGAFMSMLGIAYLNEIVRNHEVKEASQVLFEMRRQIKLSLGQTGNNILSRDGMDLALVVIYKDKCEMEYAGAQIPLILFRQVDGKKKLIEFKPDPMPIGVHLNEKDTFTNHIIPIDPSDTIYLFTDGYTDQFHSEGNLKFSRAKLKELLSQIQDEPLVEQKDILELALKEWAGNRPQVDDILVAGFGIGALFEKKLEK